MLEPCLAALTEPAVAELALPACRSAGPFEDAETIARGLRVPVAVGDFLILRALRESGGTVLQAEGWSKTYGRRTLFRQVDLLVVRGERIGILGPNGCGKSTLLNLLLGRLPPDSGRIQLGTRLEVAYFDQLRAQLEDDKTVIDNVAGGSDKVSVDGSSRHVLSYLKDFLFSDAQARARVWWRSGGERARLLLARLMAMPSNPA